MALRCIDLMIGDWVYILNGRRKQPVQVTVIGNEASDRKDVGLTVCVDKSDAYPTVIFDTDKIEPIPLTPEILEKNGWVSDNYNDPLRVYNLRRGKWHSTIAISDDGKLSIEVGAEIAKKDKRGRADLVTFVRDWCNGFCVHELQHALKLCGIHKEIVV